MRSYISANTVKSMCGKLRLQMQKDKGRLIAHTKNKQWVLVRDDSRLLLFVHSPTMPDGVYMKLGGTFLKERRFYKSPWHTPIRDNDGKVVGYHLDMCMTSHDTEWLTERLQDVWRSYGLDEEEIASSIDMLLNLC